MPPVLLQGSVFLGNVWQQVPDSLGGNLLRATAIPDCEQELCAIGNFVKVETHAASGGLGDPVDMGFNIPRQPCVQAADSQGTPEAQQHPHNLPFDSSLSPSCGNLSEKRSCTVSIALTTSLSGRLSSSWLATSRILPCSFRSLSHCLIWSDRNRNRSL